MFKIEKYDRKDVNKMFTRLGKQENVLSEHGTTAEHRLTVIKKAAKAFKKSVEESLRTSSRNKKESLEDRKQRSLEYKLGDSVLANSVQTLNEKKPSLMVTSSDFCSVSGSSASASSSGYAETSPLNTVFECYANFEKHLGHKLSECERDIERFWSDGKTPIAHLLLEEIPAVVKDKANLEKLVKKKQQSEHNLVKEEKKLETLQANALAAYAAANAAANAAAAQAAAAAGNASSVGAENNGHDDSSSLSSITAPNEPDPEILNQQIRKRDGASREVECLCREVASEQDKMTSKLLTLSSRENRYAKSVVDLLRIQLVYYEEAYHTALAQLRQMERTLQETHYRPVFGEGLEDHLKASGRRIAAPIGLAVSQLRKMGLNDEGLFRLCPQQTKLNKLKALMDSNLPLAGLLVDADPHLYASLLKCYLRELPVPLLGSNYQRWTEVLLRRRTSDRVAEIRKILREDVSSAVATNIRYLFKFLLELSTQSDKTKMDVHNIAIVLGPNLLWPTAAAGSTGSTADLSGEQDSIDLKISLVSTMIERFDVIFESDDGAIDYEDDDVDYKKLEEEIERKRVEMIRSTPSPSSPKLNNAADAIANAAAAAAATAATTTVAAVVTPPPSASHSSSENAANNSNGKTNRLSLVPGSPSEPKASPSHKRRLDVNLLKMW